MGSGDGSGDGSGVCTETSLDSGLGLGGRRSGIGLSKSGNCVLEWLRSSCDTGVAGAEMDLTKSSLPSVKLTH